MASDPEHGPVERRISDQDRQATVELLRRHTAEGTLNLDEFSDRVGSALASTTRGELDAVMADLPAFPSPPPPEPKRRKARRWVVAVMSGSQLAGRWRPGHKVTAVAFMGGCVIDLRKADIEGPEVRITAVALMGGVDVMVPPGVAVELTGIPIMGGKDLKVAHVPVRPGSPVIAVRAFPIMGGVTVRTKESRGGASGGPGAVSGGTASAEAVSAGAARQLPKPPPPAPHSIHSHDVGRRVASRVELHRSRVEENRARRTAWLTGQAVGDAAATGDPAAAQPAPPPQDRPLDGTVTVMFSDIVGYSAMTDQLGDLAAHKLLRTHNAILREQLTVHGGREVNVQGDGFLVSFPSATRALRCAIDIERAFATYCAENPEAPIRVHIGLHAGEPVRDGDDLLGRTVIIASRLSSEADPEEILVSSLLHELAHSTGEFRFSEPRHVELKGIEGTNTVFAVDWRGSD